MSMDIADANWHANTRRDTPEAHKAAKLLGIHDLYQRACDAKAVFEPLLSQALADDAKHGADLFAAAMRCDLDRSAEFYAARDAEEAAWAAYHKARRGLKEEWDSSADGMRYALDNGI